MPRAIPDLVRALVEAQPERLLGGVGRVLAKGGVPTLDAVLGAPDLAFEAPRALDAAERASMTQQLQTAFGASVQVLSPDPLDGRQRIGMWIIAATDPSEIAQREATLNAMTLADGAGRSAYWVSREVFAVVADAQYAAFIKRQPGFIGHSMDVVPPNQILTRAHVGTSFGDYTLKVSDYLSIEGNDLHATTDVYFEDQGKPVSLWDPRGGPGAVVVAGLPRSTSSPSIVTQLRFATPFQATTQGFTFPGTFGPWIGGSSFIETQDDRVTAPYWIDGAELTAPQVTWSGGDVVYFAHEPRADIEFDVSALSVGQTAHRTVRVDIVAGDVAISLSLNVVIDKIGKAPTPGSNTTPRPRLR